MNHALYTKNITKRCYDSGRSKTALTVFKHTLKMQMPTVLDNFVAQMRCQNEMTVLHDAGLIIVGASTYAAIQATWQHFQQAIQL
jgi:hypothetical protein